MQFYCPNCQNLVDTMPESEVTTKFNQLAQKAKCPICSQEMVCYGQKPPEPSATASTET